MAWAKVRFRLLDLSRPLPKSSPEGSPYLNVDQFRCKFTHRYTLALGEGKKMRRSKEQTQLRILDAATAYNVRRRENGEPEQAQCRAPPGRSNCSRILGLTVPRTLLAPHEV
jgi:hypothetical protein